ncbi:tryptophan halogenase family protein [Sphingomonas abietis]|uniref:Tryptophan 7-halogenase n=1 Tax=Sphingomonas abietis TaxID=3012344 RepID=A0ABY7NJ79_9SPHN|nr:tryptophan halogenase family protein [Sphingomonas abietis]WBO21548.1 tryptophan 7-halogenase [Sphingomonas abietis]
MIVGGGTAGWMTALALARMGPPHAPHISLVESPDIGTVGVGEATLPTIRHFNRWAGIDERDFIRETQASFKLGIEFRDWREPGHSFFHGFGDHGPEIAGLSPYHQMIRLGLGDALDQFSLPAQAARAGRFAPPSDDAKSLAATYSYAYHFDASLYAAYLRRLAIGAGVAHVQGRIDHVARNPETGLIERLSLDDDRSIAGDLFVDCSGFRSLLLGGALDVPFEDWSHWLPADRAWAVPCAGTDAIEPYTRSMACTAGWRWRIPLQHRIGNGHVYASAFQDDQAALDALIDGLDGPPLAEPRHLRFRAGHRRRFWAGNCIAIGLSSGFLEPLESTSINLIERGISLLAQLFPTAGLDDVLAREYDRHMINAFAGIRDFVILHYRLGRRTEPFWQAMRAQPMPDSLADQIALFEASGEIAIRDPESFGEPSWAAILFGLGATPRAYHPLADREPADAIERHLARGRTLIAGHVATMPPHRQFIDALAAQPISRS